MRKDVNQKARKGPIRGTPATLGGGQELSVLIHAGKHSFGISGLGFARFS
jgi:hypothetical protein